MSFRDCMDEVRRAFDGVLSDDAIMEMLEEFDAVSRATAEQRPWANVQEELFGHAEKIAKDARERVLILQRNKLLQKRVDANLETFVSQDAFAKDPASAAEARVFGSLGMQTKGGKASVFNQGRALGRYWIGSLENALTKEDLFNVVRHGAMDEQIAEEMWQLGRVKGGKPGITGSKEAQQAARIINRLQEAMVGRLNRAGAFIKRMPGYIIRQTHDPRLISRAGFDAWYKVAQPATDEGATFGRFLADDERLDAYRSAYVEFASGRHPSVAGTGPVSGSNLAKKLSEHREWHFKSGKDWHKYHLQFGRGTILEAAMNAAQTNGRAAALLEGFGSRPEERLRRLVQEQDDKAAKIGAKTSASKFRFSPDTLWAIASGEGNRPADNGLARLGNAVRSWTIASKMGSAVLTAYITDPKLHAIELARHGVPFMRRAAQPFAVVARMAAETGEQRRLANMLQAYRDGMLADLWGRWDTGDGAPGVASWMARKTMKWSGMNRWNDRSRSSITAVISHQLAENTDIAWGALDGEYRKLLEAYGLTEADWPQVGKATIDVEGVRYVVPHQLKVEEFGDAGTPEGRRAARVARDELATKLMTFVDDRMAAATNEPGARTKGILQRGQKGTIEGEFFRAATIFKSFPVELYTRVYGEGIANSEYAKLGVMVLAMGALGFVVNTVRDAARGIAPPDYGSLDPAQWRDTFLRSMLTGGGLGILGDFALGEYNRFGQSAVASIAGPVFGQVDSAMAIYSATVRGEDAKAKGVKAVYSNLPFANLWFTRTTMDYFILYPMQEYLNPGYLARMERKRQADTGQRFILSPSR